RMMERQIDESVDPDLTAAIVRLRPEIENALQEAELDQYVHRFDPDTFNPSVPLGGNLMFAAPRRALTQDELISDVGFMGMLLEQGLAEQGIAISQTLIETLNKTFGKDGTNHPLFTALGIEEAVYERLVDIASRRRDKGDVALSEDEFALLLTVPFAFTAEQIGPAFPESFKQEIVKIRQKNGPALRKQVETLFVPIDPETYLPRLTIMENALYGRVSMVAGAKAEEIVSLVTRIVSENGLRRAVAQTVFDVEIGIGGSGMPDTFMERIAFVRAGIKRPDIMIMDRALASFDEEVRLKTQTALRDLLPDSTIIVLEETIPHPDMFDLFVEIEDGRIDGVSRVEDEEDSDDLGRKLREIARTELFSGISIRNQRLLAFAARWYDAPAGQRVFSIGEKADAAYLCTSGKARLSYDGADGIERNVTEVLPGRLIGDLAIILGEKRQLHLTADEDTTFLRIGGPEFRAVLENDNGVVLSLLETVSGYLANSAELLRQANVEIARNEEEPPHEAVEKEKEEQPS
ncbi:MAG: cyclic nucleotide-binding domain-containing protein, partial [Pseudomonadota bacterium]